MSIAEASPSRANPVAETCASARGVAGCGDRCCRTAVQDPYHAARVDRRSHPPRRVDRPRRDRAAGQCGRWRRRPGGAASVPVAAGAGPSPPGPVAASRNRCLGLWRRGAGAGDPGAPGRTAAGGRRERARRGDHGALARAAGAERHGRRAAPDPAADRARRELRLRVRRARRRHLLVPPAPAQRRAGRPWALGSPDRRGGRADRRRPRRHLAARRLAAARRRLDQRRFREQARHRHGRPHRKFGHDQRHRAGELRGAGRRAHPPQADQRRQRPDLRPGVRGPRPAGGGAGRSSGRAARPGWRAGRARPGDARRPACST